jgi:hypothetical protein
MDSGAGNRPERRLMAGVLYDDLQDFAFSPA